MREIRTFKLGDLNPAPYNPQTISDENYKGLSHCISEFGCVELIVVNVRDNRNVIVGGHKRHRVLLEQFDPDYEEQCVAVDLSDIKEKELNLALNNRNIQGEYDLEKLTLILDELMAELPEQELIDLRIDQLRNEAGIVEKQGNIDDDDVPEPPKETITQPGDLWLLDKHRLMCGDSTSAEQVAELMKGEKASLFATDPPYCIDYTGNDRPNGGKDWTDTYHEIDIPDASEFMRAFYRVGLEQIKPHTALYLWHSSKRIPEIHNVCDEMNIHIHQTIIWVKPCTVLTFSFFAWRHEPCLLMWKRGDAPPHSPKDKSIGTVWPVGFMKQGDPDTPEYYTDVWELDWDGKKRPCGFHHPTSKPVEVFAIPIRVHTHPGDVCYEPFCGSGSQLIAAEKLSRKCYAMEVEPFFVDVAVQRWVAWTGQTALLMRDGVVVSELKPSDVKTK